MLYTFADANAPDRRRTQYFEMIGNRGVYHEGWFAGTIHKAPWERDPRRPLAEDVWEIYNVDEDFSQSSDLASQNPDKLEELQAVFLREAQRYHVLPIDDRSIERLDPRQAGRPDLMGGRETLTFRAPVRGIPENAFINMKNRSYTITAELDVPDGGGNGVIACQGGRFGGWAFWIDDGRLTYTYNFLNHELTNVVSSSPLPAGRQTVRAELAYDGGGVGKGGTLTLYVGDTKVGEGRVERTMSNVISLGDGADIGSDSGTPITEAYDARESGLDAGLVSVTIQLG
jgi:arylsulfatase